MLQIFWSLMKKGDIFSYKTLRKVHKVNNHQKKEQLVSAYRNADWMSHGVSQSIDCVAMDWERESKVIFCNISGITPITTF